MSDELNFDEAVVAAVITLGNKATLAQVRDIVEAIGGQETTERTLRPVLESLVSRRVLESLGQDRVAVPLKDIDGLQRTWPERIARAKELIDDKR